MRVYGFTPELGARTALPEVSGSLGPGRGAAAALRRGVRSPQRKQGARDRRRAGSRIGYPPRDSRPGKTKGWTGAHSCASCCRAHFAPLSEVARLSCRERVGPEPSRQRGTWSPCDRDLPAASPPLREGQTPRRRLWAAERGRGGARRSAFAVLFSTLEAEAESHLQR